MQVLSLDKELKELQRAVLTSDRLAATELSMAAKQLRALQGTVLRIHQERAEVKQHGQLINCLLMPLQWEQGWCPSNELQSLEHLQFLLNCSELHRSSCSGQSLRCRDEGGNVGMDRFLLWEGKGGRRSLISY